MYHTVYNSYESGSDGRDYIGKRSGENPYDEYKGSYTDNTFKPDSKIVIAYAKTAAGAVWLEEQFQKVFNVVKDPQYANRAFQTSVGFDRTGSTHTEEARGKMSAALKGRTFSEGTRKKLSAARKGKKNPMLGKTHSEKARKKMSAAKKGKMLSEEHRNKMSEANKGRPVSEETRKKMSAAMKGKRHPNFGKKWWVNEKGETQFCIQSPGPGWEQGRVYGLQ